MIVSELISILENFDSNMEVYLSSDEEGNEIKSLYDFEEELFNEENEIVFKEDITDENDIRHGIVLYP